MDSDAPRNPNQPRLRSRRLLSHFTLTLSVLLALSFVTLAVVGPTTEKAEAIAPIIVVGAVIVGAAIGDYIYNWLNEDQSGAAGEAISAYRQITAHGYNNSLELAKATALNDAELADLTANFYARIGEMAGLALYQQQDVNEEDFVYNRETVFELGNIYELLESQYLMATLGYAAVFDTLKEFQSRFVGDYSTMYIRTGYAPSTYSSTGKASDPITFVTGRVITEEQTFVFNATDTLYFFQQTAGGIGNTWHFYDLDDNELGNFTGDWSNKVVSADLQDIIGDCDADHIALKLTVDGSYDTNQMIMADVLPALTGVNDGNARPGILGYKEDDSERIFTAYMTGEGSWTTFVGSTSPNTGSPETRIEISGAGSSLITISDDLVAMGDAYASIRTLATIANNYAQTYYNYLVINGDDGIPITPVTVVPIDPIYAENMTVAELLAIYVAYMMALEEGFENGYTVTPGDVNISIESLNFVARGTIYNATGAVIASNHTIFTPFPSIADIELALGNNTMSQAGFAIKWGESSTVGELMRDPSNDAFSPETMRYVSYGVGWKFDIEEMYYQGLPADSVTLKVTDLSVHYPNITPPPAGPDMQNDAEWLSAHWYYFAIVAGVICLLAAISFRNMAIIAVGLILIGAGAIGWWMAGDTSLLSWFSMESANLRAWLQGLR